MSLAELIAALTEILKIVAWPSVVLGLVWYFRKEIKGAAPRITELGWAGAKLAPLPHEQIASPPPNEGIGEATASPPSSGGVVSAAVGSARGTGRADGISPSTAGSVELYISKLKNIVSEDQLEPAVQAIRRQLATTIGPTPQDQLEGLIYLAAWLNVQLIHERNSGMIFGSQIRLLAQMNSQPEVTPAEAMQVYNEAKAAYPDFYRSITFEQWIGFLTTAGLCAMGPNGNYVLTPFGHGFMRYIWDRRLPLNKPL
jgi:hypothetical protein